MFESEEHKLRSDCR